MDRHKIRKLKFSCSTLFSRSSRVPRHSKEADQFHIINFNKFPLLVVGVGVANADRIVLRAFSLERFSKITLTSFLKLSS